MPYDLTDYMALVRDEWWMFISVADHKQLRCWLEIKILLETDKTIFLYVTNL